ncbi:hypothetical protein BN2497_11731 [Janthinobacterium sp. CG23_2]|nr:hypothetical protein BN2497_11731 [Janthinobacterium sp. CG23_2]CUU32263.1 hypothetical protein BN3177_11731 [Janthinobacterium sp. CG23_2]
MPPAHDRWQMIKDSKLTAGLNFGKSFLPERRSGLPEPGAFPARAGGSDSIQPGCLRSRTGVADQT